MATPTTATATPAKSAFWSGSLAAGIVYNGLLFTSRCTNLLVDTTLSAVEIAAGIVCGPVVQGGVSLAKNLVRPAIEHGSQAAIMAASLATGLATGMVVYTIKAIRRDRAEVVKDFPLEVLAEAHEEESATKKFDTSPASETDNQSEFKEE